VNPSVHLLRRPVPTPVVVRDPGESRDEDEGGEPRIRCPKCDWQPDATSRWNCAPVDEPEHFPDGCGTTWNTFATRGCCPGCQHIWQWTSCLACHEWSPHEDWYAADQDDDAGR